MSRPTIVSVVNHKGGCPQNHGHGEPRSCTRSGAGKKVLLIDLDAQQNLTSSLLGTQEAIRRGADPLRLYLR